MNGHVCCLLGVCCPPGSEAQLDALATEMASDLGVQPEEVRRHAAWILKHFDLAPAGSLAQFKDAIATHARKAAQKGQG